MTAFLDRLCAFLLETPELDEAGHRDTRMAIDDTMAVALAGWHEPAARAVRAACGATDDPAFGRSGLDIEHEALIQATAAHALDYDDVQLTSVTHPSAVAVPALLAFAARRPEVRERVMPAHAIGVAVNAAIGEALGFGHYDRGWHATSTIGPIAAVASLAYLLSFDARTIRNALALAAAQCGGLQRNFGSLAKPAQAGFAAAAAARAALFAEAGVSGDHDIFGPRGYFDLYGDAEAGARAEAVALQLNQALLSRKLYPCCYATHRMIGAAIAAHPSVARADPAKLRITIDVPYGTMRPLRVFDPRDGNEAKFCAAYVTAVALGSGKVGLVDFTAEAVNRPEIRNLMDRITIAEAPLDGAIPAGLDHGVVGLSLIEGNNLIAQQTCVAYPGSPAAPPTDDQLADKIADCLEVYGRGGSAMSLEEFRAAIDVLVG